MKKRALHFILLVGIFLLYPMQTSKSFAQDVADEIDGMFDGMEKVTPDTTLTNIRFGAHETNTRLFFDLTEIPDYQIIPHPAEKSVEIQFFDTKLDPKLKNISLADRNIREARVVVDENQVSIVLFLKSWKNSFVYLPLNSPPRLAFDIRGTGVIQSSKLQKSVAELEVPEENIKYVKKEIDADKTLNEDKARPLYIEGMQQFSSMKTEEAKKTLKKLLEKYPNYPLNDAAMYAYGLILASEAGTKLDPNKYNPEKFKAAYQVYMEMLVRFPDTGYRQEVYFANARMLMELNLYTEAIGQLNLLIDDYPRDKYTPRALSQKAFLLLEQNYIDDAIKVVNKLISHYGNSSGTKEAAFKLADSLYEMERYLDAFDIYQEAIKNWPEFFKSNPSSIFYLAEIYFMNKDYDIAQDYYFRITNLFPGNENAGKAMNRLSQIYATKKDYTGSLKVLLAAKEKYKDSASGQETLIRIADIGVKGDLTHEQKVFHNLPELENPFKTYEEVIKNTSYPEIKEEALYSSGVAFIESKQFQKGIAILKQMLEEYPKTKYKKELMTRIKNNFRELIDIYYRQDGFFTVLLTYYRNFEMFLSDIEDPKIIMSIARSYGELGVYESAEHFLKKVEKLDREKVYAPMVLKTRIELAMGMKNYKRSAALADRFVKDYPNNSLKVDVLREKGRAYERMRNYDQAVLAYMESLKLDAASLEASETASVLGDIFLIQNKYSEAESAYLQTVAIFEKNAGDVETTPQYLISAYQKIGNVLFLQKKYEEAITANRLLLEKFPDLAGAQVSLLQIADSYRNLKKDEEAVKAYEDIIAKFPTTTSGRSAEASIREMKWHEKNREMLTVKPKKPRT